MDIISTLPQDITERILNLLPIRDASRTSVLSRKWRYCWTSIPVLIFDHKFFEGSSDNKNVMKHKISDSMSQILGQYTGPVVEFTMFIKLEMVSEIDKIILILLRSNKLKHFTLLNLNFQHNLYKLPSSFFSLQGLEHLDLLYCIFEPPLTFKGFSNLRWLFFINVEIPPEMLKNVLTNCPLLETLTLTKTEEKHITRRYRFTFVELFECLPSIVFLSLSKYYMEYFAADGIPKKLPTPLAHLRLLFFHVCLMEQDEILPTLCLIRSSPNLKYIWLQLHVQEPTTKDFIDLQDDPDFKLDHLEELEMLHFNNFDIEMKFV